MTASIPLSLVEGIFIIRDDDKVIGAFTTLDGLRVTLKAESYKTSGNIQIDIAALDDLDVDTVTHLVARELIGDCTDYEAWQHVNGGKFPWLEYWFDEFTTTAYKADIDRRIARHNEIFGRAA